MSGAGDGPLATIETGRLRVCFERVEGRIRHSVWAIDGGSAELLLKSVDGLCGADEFSTPVLTQLQLPPVGEAQSTVLAVGAAARDHWSLSAVADSSTGRIVLDVACRVQAPGGPLGVAYSASAPVSLNSHSNGISLAHPCFGQFELVIVSDENNAAKTSWEAQPHGRIEWTLCPPTTSPYTLRWQYTISSGAAEVR